MSSFIVMVNKYEFGARVRKALGWIAVAIRSGSNTWSWYVKFMPGVSDSSPLIKIESNGCQCFEQSVFLIFFALRVNCFKFSNPFTTKNIWRSSSFAWLGAALETATTPMNKNTKIFLREHILLYFKTRNGIDWMIANSKPLNTNWNSSTGVGRISSAC